MRGPIVRVETGIPGLDKLLTGGFVKNSIILLSGASGTGKTIFGSQFIWRGLLKGENGIYLSFEEPSEDILTSAYQLGMDFELRPNLIGRCSDIFLHIRWTKSISKFSRELKGYRQKGL